MSQGQRFEAKMRMRSELDQLRAKCFELEDELARYLAIIARQQCPKCGARLDVQEQVAPVQAAQGEG